MSMWKDLKDIQLDALKEVGNIGSGHAATALSQLLQKPIDMEVPAVHLIPFERISSMFGEEEQVVVAVFLRIEGEIEGNMFFILKKPAAYALLRSILGETSTSQKEGIFTDIEQSTLQEIGNILSGSYLSTLADLTKLNLYSSVPSLTTDMVTAVLSYGLIEFGKISDYAIMIDTVFLDTKKNSANSIKGHFFLLPDPDSFVQLFRSLGVPLND